MDYIGEHRLPGQLGQFFIVLSLIASIVATFSFFKSSTTKLKPVIAHTSFKKWINGWTPRIVYLLLILLTYFVYKSDLGNYLFKDKAANPILNTVLIVVIPFIFLLFLFYFSRFVGADDDPWKKLARFAYITETVSVVAIFSLLFYIIHNHLFEYKYAWQHSSLSLEFKYMLACFWEGQEGSFLLWSFWHCILGLVLIKTSKKWEAPVMTVVSFAQVCLATMIAGLYIFNWKMGSNPFILLRDSGVLDNAPALHLNFDINQALKPDYMSSIKDGNDLNPLLQNYWMVIHPPVLFLGFASTIVPFAFAIAGLWLKKFGDWVKAALPWALFSSAVLGVGIMMGAAWAYESLTFGGYWAWDPVENASLVPWMIMIAGLHTLLIYKHSGHSLRAAHLFMILSFGFILYSTFLTRSGVLGDSSVHAFTDLGMNWQLLAFLFIFVLPALILFFTRYRDIPAIHKEESTSSREFWMFIGSLVFFLSAIVIIGKTSLPVFNKLFGTKIAAPEDPEFAYNQIQVFVVIIIAVLTGFSQYLKYKSTDRKFFWKKIWLPTLIAVIAASLAIAFGNINYDKKGAMFLGAIWLAVACSIYAIIANAAYIFIGVKNKLKIFFFFLFFLIAVSIFLIISSPLIKVKFNSDFGEELLYSHTNAITAFSIIIGLSALIMQIYINRKRFLRLLIKVILPLLLSLLVSFIIVNTADVLYIGNALQNQTILIAITCIVYALAISLAYLGYNLWLGFKNKLKLSGGSVAHFGFGMVLLGILLSSSKKEILSYNKGMPVDFGDVSKEKPGENLTLVKGLSMPMGKFDVTYVSDSAHPKKQQWYYKIHFKSRTDKEEFTLMPNAFVNYKGNEGLMANPDSRHYWDHDVFTYVSALPNPDKQKDTATFRTKYLKPGDSIFYSKGYMVLQDVTERENLPPEILEILGPNGSVKEAPIKIYSKTGSIFSVMPSLTYAKGTLLALPDTIIPESLVLQLQKVNPDKSIELGVKESNAVLEYVTLKAYKFPFINIFWAGIIITAIGILMSMVRRIQLNRIEKA